LFSAVLGMSRALHGQFTFAIVCLAFSGICDAFDGTVARSKKGRTEDEKTFGIQLDSLCDVICFGFFPAFLCYRMGVDGIWGTVIVYAYVLCALIRLAFFNVLEEKRQRTESGCTKYYRGLPVTTASILLPFVYLFKGLFSGAVFAGILHAVLALTAFFFILDIQIPKLDVSRLLPGKK